MNNIICNIFRKSLLLYDYRIYIVGRLLLLFFESIEIVWWNFFCCALVEHFRGTV